MAECIKCRSALPAGAVYCPLCGKKQTAPTQNPKRRGNGTGSAYKRGKTWMCVYTKGYKIQNGRTMPIRFTKGGFHTKKEALEYLPTLKEKSEAPGAVTHRRPQKQPDTLDAMWDTFAHGHYKTLSKSKQSAYMIAYKKLKPLQNYRICDLTIDDLQRIVEKEAKTYYPAKDIKNLLSILFKLAMANKMTTVNIAPFIVLPPLTEKEQTPFTQNDLDVLWKDYAAGNVFTGYILLMCYTGMMPGELLKAKKSSINWEIQRIEGEGLKTDKRKATPIVIADYMVPVLESLCEYSVSEKLLCMNKDNFYKKYYFTLERLGIEKKVPYSCRHTTATDLALSGASLAIVKEVMRHSKLTSTQRYMHIDTAPQLDALNALAPDNNGGHIVPKTGQ